MHQKNISNPTASHEKNKVFPVLKVPGHAAASGE